MPTPALSPLNADANQIFIEGKIVLNNDDGSLSEPQWVRAIAVKDLLEGVLGVRVLIILVTSIRLQKIALPGCHRPGFSLCRCRKHEIHLIGQAVRRSLIEVAQMMQHEKSPGRASSSVVVLYYVHSCVLGRV